MYLLLFLVSPMCPLQWSDQSQALAPCDQALSITSPYAHFLVSHLYLTSLYSLFSQGEEPHNCIYQFPPELRLSTVTPRACLAPFHLASHSSCLTLPCSPTVVTCYITPGDDPLPPDRTPSEPHRIYT